MSYKLIAIDLDDTLLNSNLKISDSDKLYIEKAIKENIDVTIATGRMFRSAQVYAEEMNLDIPIITYQGGLIKESKTLDILYNMTLDKDISKEIIELSMNLNLHIQIYIDDEYYIDEHNDYSEYYNRNIGFPGIPVGSLNDFEFDSPNKLLIISEPERIIEHKESFIERFGDEVEISISKPKFLEFTNKKATKGLALEHLASLKSISSNDILAIGDSYNDLSMIKYAGTGVVMSNAPSEVKKYADFITLSNDEDGVSKAIRKFVFKEDV